MQCTLAPRTDILDSAAGPRTALIATVDAVDPVTDIIVSAANLRIDIVGRGADLMTVIIVSMITPTTDIATSQDP